MLKPCHRLTGQVASRIPSNCQEPRESLALSGPKQSVAGQMDEGLRSFVTDHLFGLMTDQNETDVAFDDCPELADHTPERPTHTNNEDQDLIISSKI